MWKWHSSAPYKDRSFLQQLNLQILLNDSQAFVQTWTNSWIYHGNKKTKVEIEEKGEQGERKRRRESTSDTDSSRRCLMEWGSRRFAFFGFFVVLLLAIFPQFAHTLPCFFLIESASWELGSLPRWGFSRVLTKSRLSYGRIE
jgi:hypothetical protein